MKKYLALFAAFLAIGVICIGCSPSSQESATTSEVTEEQPAAPTEVAQTETAPVEKEAPAEVAATDPNTWDGWFVGKAEWVGAQKEFKTETEEGALDDGGNALKAKAVVGDDRVRDLYLAHVMAGLESGKKYKISMDFLLDAEETEDPDSDLYISMQNEPFKNYIQYIVLDGAQADNDAIAEIEDYPDHERPDTKYVKSDLIGDGEFHKLEEEFTVAEGQTSATLAMIVRFRAMSTINNEFLFGNVKVEPVN